MLKTYRDMDIKLVRSTPEPQYIVGLAAAVTMREDTSNIKPISSQMCLYLHEAEHTSVFEHVIYSFYIEGVSRSFLAQITRQRMASPTSGSQHYQDYSGYDQIVHPSMLTPRVKSMLETGFVDYATLLSRGIPREEARQVLPNAAAVNYLWTINARSLALFLRQRCCNRNVLEMRIFAAKIHHLVRNHFPEYFEHIGPQCYNGTCKQGKMACSQGEWESAI